MSKSEYKRLAVQIPDVVATIRDQVLNEVLDMFTEKVGIPEIFGIENNTRRGHDEAVNQMRIEIELLRDK